MNLIRTSVRMGLITAGLLFALSPTAALATPPEVIVKNDVVTRSFPVDFCEFPVIADYLVRRTIVDHLDQDGDVVRSVFIIWFRGTLTNPENGTSVPNTGHVLLVDNFRTQTSSESGLRRANAPGEGIVLLDAGRLIIDWNATPEDFDDDQIVFMAGPHQAETGDTAKLCAALDG